MSYTLRVLCISLHVVLVLLTIVVLVVWARQLERRVWFLTSTMDRALLYIQAALQVFAVLFGAGMVVTTQQLAMKIHLSRYQYLTTTHDVALAWTGLGASLMSLWKQVRLPVSTQYVIPIVVYLGCMALLHITIPTLFSIVLVDDSSSSTFRVGSTLGLPVFGKSGYSDILGGTTQSLATLPALKALQNNVATLGLVGNTLYDILDDDAQSGIGSALVNTTTFEVSCGTVPSVRLNTTNYHDASVRDFAANVTFVGEIWEFNWVPWTHEAIRFPNAIDTALNDGTEFSNANNVQDFLVYSTLNFTDSEGNVGSTRSIADVVDITYIKASYQFMACHVTMSTGTGMADVQKKTLINPPARKTNSTWTPYTLGGDKTPNPWLMPWQQLFNMDRRDRPLTLGQGKGTSSDCELPLDTSDCLFTTPEMFVMNDLRVEEGSTPSGNLKLHVLENSLANVTAAIVWASIKSDFYIGSSQPEATRGQSLVHQVQQIGRLHLNELQVILSFVGSLIALLCSIILTWGNPNDIDTPGILQVMWMVQASGTPAPGSSEPDNTSGHFNIMNKIAVNHDKTAPSDYTLRKAGRVKMRLHTRGKRSADKRGMMDENVHLMPVARSS